MKRAHVIVNPNAGRAELADEVRAWAEAHRATLHESGEVGEATRRAAALAADDATGAILAAGGDGTVCQVLNGIASVDGALNRVALGVIPLGTGNDLARSLGLEPDLGVTPALDVIAHGRTRAIDVMRVETGGGDPARYLLNAACGGFSVKMAEYTSDDLKKWLGPIAYPVAAVRTLADVPWHRVRATLDGEPLEAETASVILANGRFSAGGYELAPDAALDDGRVNVLIVTAETAAERAKVLFDYLMRRHTDSPNVIYREAAEIEIACDPPMPFTGDGEPIGDTPLTCRVLPGALRVFVP